MNRLTALLLAGLLPAISGCVAAAIPLAAGGVLARGLNGASPQPTAPPPAAQASAASDLKVTRLALTALPPPDAVVSARNPAVTALRDYALAQLATPDAGKRPNALLPRASDLRLNRANCAATPPAVFIDLDPGRGTFDPLQPGQPDSALAAALAELRAKSVAVVWFTRLGAGFADATRTALAAAGMDPEGRDEVVLLSTLDERKQTRRDEVAKRVCPIALVGDERADFDELYLYLKQPDAALPLDAMIGRGWFLAGPFALDPATAADPLKP